MLKKMGIGTRMLVSCAVVIAIYAATFLFVGSLLSKVTSGTRQIDDITLPYILIVDEMDLCRSDVQQFLTDVSATHDPDGYKDAEESAKRFLADVEKYRQLFRSNNDQQGMRQIEIIEQSFNRFYESGKVMADTYINKGIDAGNLLMKGADGASGFDKDSETISKQLSDFRAQQIDAADRITADTLDRAQYTMNLMIAGVLVASIIAALFGIWITRGILGQMGGEPAYAAEIVKRVAEGDLTMQVRTRAGDTASMLYSVKDMIARLDSIISGVRLTTESIGTASREIAQGNSDLSSRTEMQASSLEETASSMEELTSTVRQNAENARQANQLATNASDIAVKGGQVVDEVVHTMSSISTSSQKIVDIISVIEGIAFQTNILALNAAVEAARAGEQGRGFAVVAGEVRTLAQRSATAAKEIKALIDDSVGRVEEGSRLVDQAGATMQEVVQAVKRVTDIMAEIAAASNEQSAGIEEVNRAIVQMDEMTQQNAALVEEATAAAEAMKEQANSLMRAVSTFRIVGGREMSGSMERHVAERAAAPADKPAARRIARRMIRAQEEKEGEWKEF